MNENINKEVKRNSNIELLRILCIISIIIHHSFVHSDNIVINVKNINYIGLYLIQILGIISNNIFILITGYYMINKKIKVRNIIKLVFESVFYSYTIMIIYYIAVGKSNIRMIIGSLIPIMSNSQWFITAYILLYISIPFINILIENIGKKQYIYLILILVTCFSILPTINLLNQYFSNYIWFVFLYLVGAYMKKYGNYVLRKNNDLLFFISSISLAILMLIKMFNISFIIFKINNFIMFILGLSIFVEFIYRKEFYNKTINYISSSILGIYLIHDNFILRPIIWGKVNIGAHIEKSYFWFYEIGVVLFIFCSCLIIDKIRIKFIETPVLKFIYKKIDNKKEENINKELVKN